ncbi:hypothetical protein FACS1894184_21130 [Clostridia bacterium]|nr:hypothetical protein FACS1894184_21130 [Clostridia bacterium]
MNDETDIMRVERLDEREGFDNPTHHIMRSAKGMKIGQVDINTLEMGEYQRPTCDRHVEKIARNFDPIKAGIIIVSERMGKLFLIDGGNRVAAMRKLSISVCPAMILLGLTAEEEADYFRKQGENTRRLSSYDKFRAGLVARDPVCIEIDVIIKKHAFSMSGSAKNADRLTAVHTVMQIYRRYGGPILDKTLMLIRETWGGHEFVTRSECLMGIAEFVFRFGTLDFSERFTNVQFAQLNQIYQMYRGGASNSLAFCKALVQRYNDSLHGGRKKLVMDIAS